MALSPLQSWRIHTYCEDDNPCILGRCWLNMNYTPVALDRQEIYVGLSFSHIDGIRARAHITLIWERVPTPLHWNPTELNAGFREYFDRDVTGFACRGMVWEHRLRNDDPWRQVMGIHGHLMLRMAILRNDIAFELGLQIGPAAPGFFHLGLNGMGPLPGHPDPLVHDDPRDPPWMQHPVLLYRRQTQW